MVGNNAWREYIQDFLESKFPNLRETGYQITSQDTDVYNCVAWAAGDTERWWWPDALEQDYWPVGVKRERTLAAFTEAFKTLEYRVCQDAFIENGFEKLPYMLMTMDNQHILPDSCITVIGLARLDPAKI